MISHHRGPDILNLYLREIGQVPLLTPAEEVRLAKRIHRGDEGAREHMIKANLRLVVKIARDYQGLGVPLLDLIGEGGAGLMKAVERFDPRKGAKLSTYASWWIKQAMRQAIRNQSRTIRLSASAQERIAQIRRAEFQLFSITGRRPGDEAVGEKVGLPAWQVREYRHAATVTTSLDAPVGEEGIASVAEMLPDQAAGAPDEALIRKSDVGLLHELMGSLDVRERMILHRRYGLGGGEEETLEQIGQRLNLTRERIRQIEELALHKLRKLMANRQSIGVAA